MSSTQVTLIGCGRWGRNLARNLHQLGALAGIVEVGPAAKTLIAEQWPAVPCWQHLTDVPRSHAVAIAVPAADHARVTRHFLERGQHVFVEKPLALDVDEGRALVALAASKGCVLMVGHLLHYHPAVEALAKLVHSGDLGRLRYVYSNRLNLGRFRREENSLWSFAPHDVSVLLRLVGSLPEQVTATGGYYLHPEIADTTMTTLTWPQGVKAHIYVSWLHPFKEQRLVVVGQDAMAVFDDRAPEHKLVLYRHGVEWLDGHPHPLKAQAEPVPLPSEEPLAKEMTVFLNACADPTQQPISDGAEGLAVLTVLDAAERSMARNGQPTQVAVPTASAAPGVQIHGSAEVHSDATIGDGTKIWHNAHIMTGTNIGRDCVFGQNTFVQTGAIVGDRVRVQNNVSIYDGVVLRDDVFCGPSAVFTNVVRPRAHVSRRDEFARTVVGKGATIGANATVVCGNEIGAFAFIGAGAVVSKDVPAHGLMIGVPAKVAGWVCSCGERLPFDVLPADGEAASCSRCGSAWQWRGRILEVS
ncbi:MAG: Gfo/Idh/MocA family oxidoreductase [Myxococcales bacterium]|nr:Gfo/Idh/MocA family oxidoreductase [Myxococcales bacterium]